MPPRHRPSRAIPTVWLMTDERLGESLWLALARLPRGAGIVFRHHATPVAERRLLFDRVRRLARRRRLMLLLADSAEQARAWGADGVHGRGRNAVWPILLRSAPVHDIGEMALAARLGADLLFLSPVFATRSHPGGRTLGRWRFAALARHAHVPIIALGGMDSHRWRQLGKLGADGWAAIDAWGAAGGFALENKG